jgi:hypothetical protein
MGSNSNVRVHLSKRGNTISFIPFTILWMLSLNMVVFGQNLTFNGAIPSINITKNNSEKWSSNLFISSTFDLLSSTQNGIKYPANDMQFYFQPSVQYRFNPALAVAASYTYQRNAPLQQVMTDEHRIWEQVSYATNLKYGRLSNRLRYEQRLSLIHI